MSEIARIPIDPARDVWILVGEGNPDGVLTAGVGSQFWNIVDGAAFNKTATDETSWEQIGSGSGGGGTGLTLSYLGYNSIGSSIEVTSGSRQYNKKITIPSDGILLNIAVYMKVTSQFWLNSTVGVQTDNAGVPSSVIAHASSGPVNLQNNINKWLTTPLNLELSAGDYWICFCADQAFSLYYDSGTDTYNDPGTLGLKDGDLVTPTVTAKKYSMRAAFLPL